MWSRQEMKRTVALGTEPPKYKRTDSYNWMGI